MTNFEQQLQFFFTVPEKEIQQISAYFQLFEIKKGELFLEKGCTSKRMGFVKSGILRDFFYTNDKEITKWISTEGQFVVELTSFLFQEPARWSIEALTDCELYVIDETNYRKLNTEIAIWPELEKRFITKCFAYMEGRIITHLSLSSEERYAAYFEKNKEHFNQIPLQYIASMLGMTPETMSRIRKKRVS